MICNNNTFTIYLLNVIINSININVITRTIICTKNNKNKQIQNINLRAYACHGNSTKGLGSVGQVKLFTALSRARAVRYIPTHDTEYSRAVTPATI